MNADNIIYLITTTCLTIAYIGAIIYQNNKIKSLTKSISTQSEIIKDMNSYREFLNPNDFKEHVNIKVETAQLKTKKELESEFERKILEIGKTITDNMNSYYMETNKVLLKALSDLSLEPIMYIVSQFPNNDQKDERDKYFESKFPNAKSFLIEWCDLYLSSKVHNDPSV